MSTATVLIVDDDARIRETLEIMVRGLGHDVLSAEDVPSAKALFTQSTIGVVVTDLRMPGGSGLDLVDWIRNEGYATPVILLTAHGTVENAVDAMKRGAFDYLLKPFDASEVEIRIARALLLRRYMAENQQLRDDDGGAYGIIGVSEPMRRVLELVGQVAASDSAVLITGETGTGKELIARAIHSRSARHDRLLVPVNLAAIPEDLIESELFGHTRGAFTGAMANREGKFEVAHEGTLFLDEIGDAPLPVQVKILRVLEDGMIERVGGNTQRRIDARLVSATNRDLEAAVKAETFRADLYYRLCVIRIHIPPLRERPDDIPYLVAHFLRKHAGGKSVPVITDGALSMLVDHAWPGNIRELENAVERAVVLRTSDTIGANLFNLGVSGAAASSEKALPRLGEALDKVEREMIIKALDETGNVKARAARLLGVSERKLWYKLEKHDIK